MIRSLSRNARQLTTGLLAVWVVVIVCVGLIARAFGGRKTQGTVLEVAFDVTVPVIVLAAGWIIYRTRLIIASDHVEVINPLRATNVPFSRIDGIRLRRRGIMTMLGVATIDFRRPDGRRASVDALALPFGRLEEFLAAIPADVRDRWMSPPSAGNHSP